MSNQTAGYLEGVHKFFDAKTYEHLMSAMFDIFPGMSAPEATKLYFRFIFGLLYALLFIVGVPLNLITAWLTIKKRSMELSSKIHFLSLLIANLVLLIVTIPWVPVSTMRITWPFTATACLTLPVIQGISACVTTFQLCALGVRRFINLMYRSRNRIDLLISILCVSLIWIMGILLMAPYGVFTKFTQHKNRFYMQYFEIDGGRFCSEDWPNSATSGTYRISIFLIHFMFPVAILITLFGLAKHEEEGRKMGLIGSEEVPEDSKSDMSDKSVETETNQFQHFYQLLIGVIVLHCFWAPLDITNIAMDLNESVQRWKHLISMAVGFHILGLLTTCLSPFLLNFIEPNTDLREDLKSLIPTRLSALKRNQMENNTNSGFTHSEFSQA